MSSVDPVEAVDWRRQKAAHRRFSAAHEADKNKVGGKKRGAGNNGHGKGEPRRGGWRRQRSMAAGARPTPAATLAKNRFLPLRKPAPTWFIPASYPTDRERLTAPPVAISPPVSELLPDNPLK